MRIAIGQFSAGMDKPANLARISDLTARAADAGAKVVVFPEGAMCDFGAATDDLHGVAEPLDGRFVQTLSELAARFGLTVVAGMFESIPGEKLIYNSAVVVDPAKGLVGTYRKRHLFDAFGEMESERFRRGDEDPLLVEIGGFKTAVVICYDIRFASFIERAADARGRAAGGAGGVGGRAAQRGTPERPRARARARQHDVCRGGRADRTCLHGPERDRRSTWGDARGAGDAEGVAVAEVSRERLKAARARLPVLAQRRAALNVGAGTPASRR